MVIFYFFILYIHKSTQGFVHEALSHYISHILNLIGPSNPHYLYNNNNNIQDFFCVLDKGAKICLAKNSNAS